MSIIDQIRAEVERLQHSEIPHTDEWWDGADYVRRQIKAKLSEIEKSEKPTNPTLQEQPVCEDVDEEIYKAKAKVALAFGGVTGEQDRILIGFARHFYELGKQSKGEGWCEKDESILNNIVEYKYLNIDDLEWLKALPQRFDLQPKPEVSEDLEEDENIFANKDLNGEVRKFIEQEKKENHGDLPCYGDFGIQMIARHFAQWQKEQDTRDMYMSDNRHFQKVYELGKKDMKEQMMKEAVEADVNTYEDLVSGESTAEFIVDMPVGNLGDKVKLIIVKKA